MIADSAPAAPVQRGGGELYQLAYIGGTTGRSKAAMLSQPNVVFGAMTARAEGYFRDDAAYLFCAPIFHTSGSWPCIATLGTCGTAVLMSQFDPGAALKLIEQHGVTESLMVPSMIQLLIEHSDFPATSVSSFKTMIYGAAPITEALLKRASAAFPTARFIQVYGMTELPPMCASLPGECLHDVYRAAGRATFGVELTIVYEKDNEVPRGNSGEICARGENVMLGYWRRPAETEAAMRDGGRMDEGVFVYVVDRVKDMIISSDKNIYPTEVENAVCLHPAVQQCAVIGTPCDKWGEQVHAVVRLYDGAQVSEDEIFAHCRALIATYKVPRSVRFHHGPFPVTPTNKILKRERRRPFWEGRIRFI